MAGEWREMCLGDVADIVMGQSPPGATYNETGEGLPFFQGVKDFNYRYPTPRVFCSAPSRVARPGDILFSVRAPIGRVNVVDRECAIGRGLAIIRPHRQPSARYIEFVLRHLEPGWHTIEGGGSVFGNATRQDLEQLRLPWPSAESERAAIAHILGTLDDKIELNRRMNETLEGMGRAIFKSWFVDFDPVRAKMEGRLPALSEARQAGQPPGMDATATALFPDSFEDSPLGKIPKGWRVGKLSDLCATQYGYTASAKEEPVGPKFLRVTDINKLNWIEWDFVPYCSISKEKKAKYALKVSDIVVARMADPGKSAIIEQPIDAVFASYLVRLKTESLAHAYYVYNFLKSPAYSEYSEGAMSGSVQANMNARVIVGCQLIIPPSEVMKAFPNKILPFRQQLVANLNQCSTLAAIRDALLPKLLSGEIRVKDAEKFVEKLG